MNGRSCGFAATSEYKVPEWRFYSECSFCAAGNSRCIAQLKAFETFQRLKPREQNGRRQRILVESSETNVWRQKKLFPVRHVNRNSKSRTEAPIRAPKVLGNSANLLTERVKAESVAAHVFGVFLMLGNEIVLRRFLCRTLMGKRKRLNRSTSTSGRRFAHAKLMTPHHFVV